MAIQALAAHDWDGVPGSGPEVAIEIDDNKKGHAAINVDLPGGSGDTEGILKAPYQDRIHGVRECPAVPRYRCVTRFRQLGITSFHKTWYNILCWIC